jgi:hypothetical protein
VHPVRNVSKRLRPLAALAGLALAFGACDEQLNGGVGCLNLCPPVQVDMRDTTLFAVILDTSIAGYPSLGGEFQFFVANFGDTLESAAVIRFDSIPTLWRPVNGSEDSSIVYIDTGSHLRLTVATGDTLALATTIEVYNVDLQGAEDTLPETVVSAFTPDRLLGSITVPADSLRDSVNVPIDPAFILAKIQEGNRIRLGVKVAQAGNPRVRIASTNGGGAAQLVFRPSPDTTVLDIINEPFSRTPPDAFLANDLADYLVVLKSPPAPPPNVFRVGGLPARRVYLRFNIPADILDSSNVVRATLFLTQRPNTFAPQPNDTVGLGHFGVVSGATVTDLTRALFFLQRLSNRDTLRVVAADTGLRSFEMIDWVRAWRGTSPLKTPRAIGLATSAEGENGLQLDFFSIEAGLAERPRLRLTYIPRTAGALP